MPPAAKHNRCVVLYDLNSRNQRQLRRALFKVYSYNYFRNSKDSVNLVLVNSKATGNRMNAKFGKGYCHIKEISTDPEPYNLLAVHEKIEVNNAEGANWKEAIRLAIQILQSGSPAGVITYQILYLTDLSSSQYSEESLREIMADLRKFDIFLYIIGPKVRFSRPLTDIQHLQDIMQSILLDEENINLKEAKELINEGANVVIADVKEGLQLFLNYKNPIGKQAWPVPLSIGTNIKIPVGTSKYMESDRGFELVLKSKRFKYLNTQYVLSSVEDSTKIYPEEDTLRGISRHGKFIPIQNNDLFNSNNERTFSLMFITEIQNIPEYMMKGPACYLVAKDRKSSPQSLHALILGLDKKKYCLVVRRVYNKGNRAIYLALIPNSSKLQFRAVQLPFENEVVFGWQEEELKKDEAAVSEEVNSFLNELAPNCMMTPNVVSISSAALNNAADKMLSERLNLQEVELDVFATNIEHVGAKLRAIWPSRVAQVQVDQQTYDLDSDDEEFF